MRTAIPSKELQLLVVGPKTTIKPVRLQTVTFNKDIPSTTVDEIGNASDVGDSKDIPNVTLTMRAFDVGIKTFAVLTGSSVTSYPPTGVDISNLGQMDAILHVKDPNLAVYVKTAHARKLQIRDFTFTYSVQGETTEEYTAVGSEKRWFKNDVLVDAFTTGTGFTLTHTPVALKNGHKAISVVVDGTYFDEVAAGPTAGQYRISGTTLTLGTAAASQVLAVYQAALGASWSDVSDLSMPVAVKGKDVTVTIAASGIKRVQSITINGSLNIQPVREMGNREIVGYQKQVPQITGNISVLDTDTELIDLLTNGAISADTEWSAGEGCPAVTVPILIELQDPCSTTAPYTVVKSIYLDSIGITSDGYTSNVNQNATQTFNFKSLTAHCVVYSGAK